MAKLFFLLDGNSMGEYALDQERITIGRRPSNQIHIDNLAISGEHAVIVTIGNDSFLEDLNSTNGTIVNGESIKKHVLQHDDVIEFGKYELKYVNENQLGKPHHDGFEQTMLLMPNKQIKPFRQKKEIDNPDSEKPAAENLTAESTISKKDLTESTLKNEIADSKVNHQQHEAVSMPNQSLVEAVQPIEESPIRKPKATVILEAARLQVLNGASAGRELLLNKTMTTLGKPGSQVAVINKRPNGYYITHVGGNSLPKVNGQNIGLQAHALNHRDVVELAGTKMEFFFE